MRCLLPLPVTVMTSPWPGAGTLAALEPERLGDAQPAAVEQRQHGGVAREDPGLAFLAGAQVGVGDALGGGDGERLRQRLGNLRRAHRGERADLALAVAFEEARERAHAGQRAHQRAAADARRAPRRHEGAHVLRGELGELGQRWRAAEMLGEKAEELARRRARRPPAVFARHPALGAEMAQPARDLGRHVGGGSGKGSRSAPSRVRLRCPPHPEEPPTAGLESGTSPSFETAASRPRR